MRSGRADVKRQNYDAIFFVTGTAKCSTMSAPVDARYGTYNSVSGNQTNHIAGDQHNYYGAPTTEISSQIECLQEDVIDASAGSVIDAKLATLPVADSSSWDPSKVCLAGTRAELVGKIWEFISTATSRSRSARILLVTGPAGVGKTAVAHSIAQRCRAEGVLASSFFFSATHRDRARALFTTMARDFASRDRELKRLIGIAIDHDASLPTAPLSRQFEDLILTPLCNYHPKGIFVVVIDAFDESGDDQPPEPDRILDIFRDRLPLLPSNICFIVTTRVGREIDFLSEEEHVSTQTVDINDSRNIADIEAFVRHVLKDIARRKRLGKGWPDERLVQDVTRRSEGLFLWVATIHRLLCTVADPEATLSNILSGQKLGLSAQRKIDGMFNAVLATFDHDDEEFLTAYELLMGTILLALSPLTPLALKAFASTLSSREVSHYLHKMGPLLTATGEADEHVHIIHLSLREFLLGSAPSPNPHREWFHISVKVHHARMALSCLNLMNKQIRSDISGLGYATKQVADEWSQHGVSDILESLSEEFLYSCKYWTCHILQVDEPDNDLLEALENFISQHFIGWMEILCSKDRYQDATEIFEWIGSHSPSLMPLLKTPKHAHAINGIRKCLSQMTRMDEALIAGEDATDLWRALSKDDCVAHEPALALSLRQLSLDLSNVGSKDAALAANLEAVALWREIVQHDALRQSDLASSLSLLSLTYQETGSPAQSLAAAREAVEMQRSVVKERDNPCSSRDLAAFLSNLHVALSKVGLSEEALAAIQESTDLLRCVRRSADAPNVDSLLASVLSNLFGILSEMGRHGEALEAIREALVIQRDLSRDQPLRCMPRLAMYLSDLFLALITLGHKEEALSAIQESVELQRNLTKDHPAIYRAFLVTALGNLAAGLFETGRLAEAEAPMREAVDICRELAIERPAVYNSELARCLFSLAFGWVKLEGGQAALSTIQESVLLYREAAKEYPTVYDASLADALECLADCLSDIGDLGGALAARGEAALLWSQGATRRYHLSGVESSHGKADSDTDG
ncbi:hypothetical protein HWV62_26048 [Athelia sp. TMB]|nr:hypothetical protein HWV62_26048 [Athelia sp. TMB]